MSKPKVLTKEIAVKFLKDPDWNNEFTVVEDAAAEVLAQSNGDIKLNCVKNISVAAATSLAKIKPVAGDFNSLQLESLSLNPEIAAALAGYQGDQIVLGCTKIDVQTIKAFKSFKGQLWLGNVTQLDDESAAELATRPGADRHWSRAFPNGGAYLDGLTEYNATQGHLQLAHSICQWEKNSSLGLRGAKSISPEALEIFAGFEGKEILTSTPEALNKLKSQRLASAKAAIREGRLLMPAEWQNARIIPATQPAKPLKGRGAERESPKGQSWWLPNKVCSWFVQKLDDAHKTSVSGYGSGSGKTALISPEAVKLLREKAETWFWLMESEVKGAKEKEASSIKSLAAIKPPKQFKDGQVSLPAPRMPVAKAYCWKPDFEGDDYQSVLHYYSYLPSEHVGAITDPNGYPAKAMTPEAADLYRQHRRFWEAKHAEAKMLSKAALKAQKKAVEQKLDKSAATAGLSREELETKLERLTKLVEQGDLNLVADMVAGFGVPWLYEAVLAGASIKAEGDLKAGKVLKRFKKHDKIVMLLALAFMPEGSAVDHSLHRNSMIRIDVDDDNLKLLEKYIIPNVPNLEPRSVKFWSQKNISTETVKFLTKASSELSLKMDCLSDDVASILSGHKGKLSLRGFSTLTDIAADALSKHCGDLELGVTELSVQQASLLAKHGGALHLSYLSKINAEVAKALSDKVGSCSIYYKVGCVDSDLVSDSEAEVLALFQGDLTLFCKQLSPSAAKSLAQKSGLLSLNSLESLDLEVAGYLSKLRGPLLIGDEARQCVASSEAIEALVKTLSGGDLNFEPCELADTACEALAGFSGDVSFIEYVYGNITEMTEAGALSLAKRKSLGVQRTKIPKAARKILEQHGSWDGMTWTRKR